MKKIKVTLPMQMFSAFILAIIVGCFLRKSPYIATEYIKPYGTIFLNILKCFVCVGVFFAIIYGIASLRDLKKFWKIIGISIIYYLGTTVIAIVIGIAIASLMEGGFPLLPTNDLSYGPVDTDIDFMDRIVDMFPSSIVRPFYDLNMQQIMVTALIIGVSLILISDFDEMDFPIIDKANDICSKVMRIILKLSPVGLFCLMCPEVTVYGFDLVRSLSMVLLAAYLGHEIHALVVYALVVKEIGHVSPKAFFKGMMPAILFSFSSSSSLCTIPLNMDCAEKLGADTEVSSIVMPFGSMYNMDGTAIYQGVCIMFIASCYGIDLTFSQMVLIVFTTVLSSIGTAGIPSAGMVTLAIVLESVGLPVAGIALVASVDGIFGMGRSAINSTGDAVCVIIVSEIMRKHKAKKEKRRMRQN